MKRLALGLLVVSSLSFAPAVLAAPPSSSGFVGSWTAIDCPSFEGAPPDCDVPWSEGGPLGDASDLTLLIGPGDAPRVTFQDFYGSSCANAGSPATHWTGAGRGTYEDIYLFVPLDNAGCGAFQPSDIELQFYWDEGSDTLWEDEDGNSLGTLWIRAR
jgi:hypothetical protein